MKISFKKIVTDIRERERERVLVTKVDYELAASYTQRS